MGQYPCHVLLIEDNPGDAVLVRESLETIDPFEFQMTVGASLADGMGLLRERTFDVILLDLSLPDSQGLDTLKAVQATAERTPIIVLTGLSDDQTTTAAMAKGAQDYLVKDPGNYGVLYHSIRYSIERNGLTQKIKGYTAPKQTLDPFAPRLRPASPGHWQGEFLEFSQSILRAERQKENKEFALDNAAQEKKAARESSEIDCNQVVEKILYHFQREMSLAKIDFLSNTLPVIHGNPFQITQLFQSLISEAIRLGARTFDPVALTATEQSTHWFFSLVQGAGYPHGERFPAGDTASPPLLAKPHDTYLWPGWTLCHEIVEAHGGTLGHHPLPEGGNHFWFTLPKSKRSDFPL